MRTDPVIFEIITAANMTGIKQAQAGFLGMSNALSAAIVGLGLAVIAGKSAIENTEAQEKAHKSLQQATDVSKENFNALQKAFDDWAEANKRYIPDQYAAETALAAFVRAGANAQDAMRELNDALDLSTLRGMDLEDAQKQITLALTGSSKALKILGITTDEYSAIMKDKTLTTEQKHLALLALIESKTKDGRKAQTDLKESTQALNKDWQDMSTIVGPPLVGLLGGIADAADAIIQKLNELGHNKDWNKFLHDAFGGLQRDVLLLTLGVRDLLKLLGIAQGEAKGIGGSLGGLLAPKKAATGYEGMVNRPTLFMAGEAGSEHVSITPSGGGGGAGHGGNVYIDLRGAFVPDGPSIDRLANLILQRARHAPGM